MALVGGFAGARIGYVIPRFLGDDGFIHNPLDIFAIWQGGLAFFGGLVGGALAVVLYLRRKKVALGPIADAFAPALPLAQAFGRWGNYFNQELFGRPTDLPWALQVDPGPAERAGFSGESTFHPTFLYESLWNLALVWVILVLDKRKVFTRRGSLFFVYLIGYGVGRGWVEALRVDIPERYLGLSRNNWIAIAVVIIGIVGLWWYERRSNAAKRTDELTVESRGFDPLDPRIVEMHHPETEVAADDDGTLPAQPDDDSDEHDPNPLAPEDPDADHDRE